MQAAGQKHSASPAMMGLSVSRSRHILQMPCLCLLAAGSQPQPYVLIFYFRCEPPTPPTSPGKNKHVMTCHAVMHPSSRKNMVYLAGLSGNRGQIWSEKLFFYLHNFLEEVGNKLTALLKLRWPLGRAWMGRFYNFLYNCVVIRTMELSLLSSQITLIHQTKRLRAKCTTYL